MATSHHRQCSICLEDFKKPKFIDCHHTFCLECLRGLSTYAPRPLKCPVCMRVFNLPTGGVDHLTANFYMDVNEDSQEEDEGKVIGQEKQQKQKNIEKRIAERKAIQLKFLFDLRYTESFGGVFFMFHLFKNNTDEWGETLALRIFLSKKESPFVHSCQVDHYITLVNQKDIKFSTKRTGQCSFLQVADHPYSTKFEIDLIKFSHVTDPDYGFIVKKSKDIFTFRFLIGIILTKIKKVEFNLD
ncbi:hypothetical protein LOTGIDRAFT_164295 [Lottia gigantea]|uniref:RING-type domain-containing protein n=1 Tax=Lottia gigantea TaxID=225164 RepID=V4BNF1_LOTGI|nr:hypothetical protein LOTGIDRAFT_164295 [Lottia gigantea]ESO90369.1 hypothetical protein LOTGIDRAFT_164295 [Lottia gigantea]